jgi:hypothetical protein
MYRAREYRVGSSWALALALAGCAGSTPRASAPTSEHHERHSSAVTWPAPRERAEAETGVLVMTPLPARQLARSAVRGFFEAVRHESVNELSVWLAEDATLSSGPGTTPEAITKVWAARFKQLDYGFGGALAPYRADDVGLFTASELLELGRSRGFALAPEGDEILAVINTRDRRRVSGPRHFGKRLEFVLGPTSDGYRIRRMFEDYRLP